MHEHSEHKGKFWEHWGRERGFFPGGFGRRHEEGEESWRGRGGRGFGRPFDHGELRLVILALVAEKPRHGYEIIKAIEDRFGWQLHAEPRRRLPNPHHARRIGARHGRGVGR